MSSQNVAFLMSYWAEKTDGVTAVNQSPIWEYFVLDLIRNDVQQY